MIPDFKQQMNQIAKREKLAHELAGTVTVKPTKYMCPNCQSGTVSVMPVADGMDDFKLLMKCDNCGIIVESN